MSLIKRVQTLELTPPRPTPRPDLGLLSDDELGALERVYERIEAGMALSEEEERERQQIEDAIHARMATTRR